MKIHRRHLLLGAGSSAVVLPELAAALLHFTSQGAKGAPAAATTGEPYRHSLYQSLPGKPAIEVWGWSGVINYQRTLGHATPQDLIELGRESQQWGANMIEVMPFKIAPGGYVMSWNPDDPIAKPDHGVYFYDDENWSDDAYRDLFSQWHDMDLLASLCVNSIGATWGDVGPGWKPPTGSVERDVMARWGRDFFNRFAYADQRGYLDILDTERVSGMERSLMWSVNPGAVPLLCAPTDHHQEGFVYSFCCAGRKRNGVIGLDDRSGHDLKTKYPYFSYQADSRPRKTLHPWGRFGGYSYPDWTVKQLNDYSRERKLRGNNLHTALWWFNDVAEMHSPIDRQVIHGASLDPLRCAVATPLLTTGQFNPYTAALNSAKLGGLEQRSYPRGTPMLHNNHLALFLPRCRQGGELVVDRQRLGEFHDKHDQQLTLTERLLEVSVAGQRLDAPLLDAVERPGDEFAVSLAAALAEGETTLIGQPGAFAPPGGFAGPTETLVVRHRDDTGDVFPGGMRHAGEAWPANVDLRLAAPAGTYALVLQVAGAGAVELLVNGERTAVETIASATPQPWPVTFALSQPGEQTLSLVCWDGEIRFERVELVRLADSAVSRRVPEPAGFVARWNEELVLPLEEGTLREERRYSMVNDGPWLELEIERQLDGAAPATLVHTALGCEAYDTLEIDGTTYQERVDLAAVPEELRLVDSTGRAPSLTLAVQSNGPLVGLAFAPREGVTLASRMGDSERLSIVWMLAEGLYDAQELRGKVPAVVAPQRIEWDGTGTTQVTNDLDLPVVRLVRLEGEVAGPFYVREPDPAGEASWWMARGGHAEYQGDATYLRLYLPPRGTAAIQRYAPIAGCAKGGIGAQHLVAIRDDMTHHRCVARVLEVIPYVFAPPIEFAEPFTRVTLNGEPWSYFEAQTVYLPNRKGDYEIRTYTDTPRTPHVVATQGTLTAARWEGDTLTITAEDPPWYAPGLPWYAVGIHCEGRRLESISDNAERIDFNPEWLLPEQRRAMEQYVALRIFPGKTAIRFRPEGEA